mmetsp:Transcript_43729/g.119515  ORF Transcript_43729/g.119515 Transcript_43729/m.119515 type:complete len:156 (+) Transcript_43729:576-1043(+)
MVGVDLSPKMIDISREKGGYDELMVDDVHTALDVQPDKSLNLLLSADTFIYVGDLERCFSQAKVKLAEGGLFALSVELLSEVDGGAAEEEAASGTAGAGFKLQRSGRYGHTPEYIAGLAARSGMVVELQRDIVVRKEQATPIPGLVYVLRRTQAE